MKKIEVKNKKTFIIVSIVVLVVILVIWLIARARKKDNESETTVTGEIDESLFPLKSGSDNDYVKVLQERLIAAGADLSQYGADGIFGPETAAAAQSVLGTAQVSYEQFKDLV